MLLEQYERRNAEQHPSQWPKNIRQALQHRVLILSHPFTAPPTHNLLTVDGSSERSLFLNGTSTGTPRFGGLKYIIRVRLAMKLNWFSTDWRRGKNGKHQLENFNPKFSFCFHSTNGFANFIYLGHQLYYPPAQFSYVSYVRNKSAIVQPIREERRNFSQIASVANQ